MADDYLARKKNACATIFAVLFFPLSLYLSSFSALRRTEMWISRSDTLGGENRIKTGEVNERGDHQLAQDKNRRPMFCDDVDNESFNNGQVNCV